MNCMINLCKLQCINNLIQISIDLYYNVNNCSDSEHNNIAGLHKYRLLNFNMHDRIHKCSDYVESSANTDNIGTSLLHILVIIRCRHG